MFFLSLYVCVHVCTFFLNFASVNSYSLAPVYFWNVPIILWAISYFLEQKDLPDPSTSPTLESSCKGIMLIETKIWELAVLIGLGVS